MAATGSPDAPSILGSMRPDGSRLKIHPADYSGAWKRRRRAVFAALVAIYVLAPFVQIHGHPAIQLDVQHRRFFLVGHTFNAQDFWLVLLLSLGFVFGLLFVTAWRGRVWCGFACPQTVFLEGVYRPIERLIEGSREQRIKLDASPMSFNKAWRRGLKYLAFFLVSVAIAHTATAIFVSPRELWLMIIEGPRAHLEAFALTTGFTAILAFNFTWFREQFCVVLCPYGRLQSVLLDRDSISVAYDERRGEPRGHLAKVAVTPPRGDCIDCKRCVVVCPTGIDIRNGLQMECLACTQCIDACDDVMKKVSRPTGLIRYASMTQLQGQPSVWARPRLLVYGALMLLSFGTLGISLVVRTPFESNIVRTSGTSPWFIDAQNHEIRNAFEVHLVNKNSQSATFSLRILESPHMQAIIATPRVTVPSLGDTRVPVIVSIGEEFATPSIELVLEITDELSTVVKRQPVRFIAPASRPARGQPEKKSGTPLGP